MAAVWLVIGTSAFAATSEIHRSRLWYTRPAVTGSVKGLRARGGFEVDLAWDTGSLTSAVIHSKLGNACRVVCGDTVVDLHTRVGGNYKFDGGLHADEAY